MPVSTKFISPKCRFPPNLFRRKCRFPPNLIEKGTFVQGGNYALSAWKALQSVAIVTGYEVPGRNCCSNSAWKAVRLWRCLECKSCGVVPSRHLVLASPIRALRTRLPTLRSVVPSRHSSSPKSINVSIFVTTTGTTFWGQLAVAILRTRRRI